MSSEIIGYLGIEGSDSHQASGEIFPGREYRGFSHFPAIFKEVEYERAVCAVVPVDNALSGRIDGIYHELSNTILNIDQEYILPIHHCLLIYRNPIELPGGTDHETPKNEGGIILTEIREIFSHPQAFLQCQQFIAKFMPNAVLRDATDTASAALEVSTTARTDVAAISSRTCASRYNLHVLRQDIEDDPGNATRFLVLSKKGLQDSKPTSPAITTILFQTKHEPGSLAGALAAFADKGINLTKLETYMASRERRKPTFYVDVGEHLYADRMIAAMAAFAEEVEHWRILGTYAASPQRGVVSGFLTI
jgi:prephenate dehydratase